jgi:hypothetical protein
MGASFPNFIEIYTSAALNRPSINPKMWFLVRRPFEEDSNQVTHCRRKPALQNNAGIRWSGALTRKILPAFATCGDHPMLDVSGPQSTINDTPADSFKYCVAYTAGECSDSTYSRITKAGDIYANCPMMRGGSNACGSGGGDDRNLYLGNSGAFVQSIAQVGVTFATTNTGETLTFTNGFRRYRLGTTYWNSRVTPDGN